MGFLLVTVAMDLRGSKKPARIALYALGHKKAPGIFAYVSSVNAGIIYRHIRMCDMLLAQT